VRWRRITTVRLRSRWRSNRERYEQRCSDDCGRSNHERASLMSISLGCFSS
jgi:hypothetical protein